MKPVFISILIQIQHTVSSQFYNFSVQHFFDSCIINNCMTICGSCRSSGRSSLSYWTEQVYIAFFISIKDTFRKVIRTYSSVIPAFWIEIILQIRCIKNSTMPCIYLIYGKPEFILRQIRKLIICIRPAVTVRQNIIIFRRINHITFSCHNRAHT